MTYNIEILSEIDNALLRRKDVKVKVHHPEEATPARTKIRKLIAAHYNKPEEQTFVFRQDRRFGIAACTVHARIYNTVEDAQEVEYEHIKKRNTGAVAEKSGE